MERTERMPMAASGGSGSDGNIERPRPIEVKGHGCRGLLTGAGAEAYVGSGYTQKETPMRSTWPVVLAAVMLGAALKPAQATCFLVFDRNDNLIYRSPQAPVDMSDPNDRAATAAREAMRARGEYMMYIE